MAGKNLQQKLKFHITIFSIDTQNIAAASCCGFNILDYNPMFHSIIVKTFKNLFLIISILIVVLLSISIGKKALFAATCSNFCGKFCNQTTLKS